MLGGLGGILPWGSFEIQRAKYGILQQNCIWLATLKLLSEGKPTRTRRLCLKTSEAEGRGGLGITSSSEEVYELML